MCTVRCSAVSHDSPWNGVVLRRPISKRTVRQKRYDANSSWPQSRQLPREAAVDVHGVQQLHFRVLRNVRTLSERRRGWAAVDLPPNLDADSAPREALGSAAIGAPSVCRFESSSAFAGQSAAADPRRTERMGASVGASEGGEERRRNARNAKLLQAPSQPAGHTRKRHGDWRGAAGTCSCAALPQPKARKTLPRLGEAEPRRASPSLGSPA